MRGRLGWSGVRRPLAAMGVACLLTAGCTADRGEPVAAPAPARSDAPTLATPPAKRGALAYALDGDIYVAEWNGSNPVRIADGRPADVWEDGFLIEQNCGPGEYHAEGPIWSPDGRYLAFRHTDCEAARDEWWDVVISDREGNVVTSFPSEGWGISWSPDSTRVAVWVRWERGQIGIYGLDGERQALVTAPPGWRTGEFDPVWSPDGESVVFGIHYVIPLDGSTPRTVPWPFRRDAAWGTYSPDGSRVAYTANRSLVVAAADGSDPEEMSGGFWPGSLAWSPTGDRIAFTSGDSTELRLLDVGSGTVTLLTETDGSAVLSIMAGGGFEFSPQGHRILFSKTEDRGRGVSSLWRINANGSDLRRLVAGTAWGDWRSPSQTR